MEYCLLGKIYGGGLDDWKRIQAHGISMLIYLNKNKWYVVGTLFKIYKTLLAMPITLPN